MRSNSGKDESRDNLHDPTIRDRIEAREKASHRPPVSQGKPRGDPGKGRKDYPEPPGGSGSAPRPGPAGGPARASPPGPASRARSRPRASPPPPTRPATGYPQGP